MFEIHLHKTFKRKKGLVPLSFDITFPSGTTVGIYGPSGVGKSTLLRLIAGLESPDSGSLKVNEVSWYNGLEKTSVPIQKRNLGFVFQDFNLFPNMTVLKNLRYASADGNIPESVMNILKRSGLDPVLNSYPHELSGGQRQRIAILRSLCQHPEILLLDEPFSALDDESILLLIEEIKLIQAEFDMSIVVVSHRRDVLAAMCQHIVRLDENGEHQSGTPAEMFPNGVNLFG